MKPNEPKDMWSRVEKRGATECWPWKGGTFSGRYGRFTVRRKAELAHVLAYILTNGPVPAGLFVMHKCNNKLCCNPSHLTVGSNSQNQRHASLSGAFPVGKTGKRGISFDKKRNYWTAQGYLNGKKKNLYTGPHEAKAIAARKQWESEVGISFNNERNCK